MKFTDSAGMDKIAKQVYEENLTNFAIEGPPCSKCHFWQPGFVTYNGVYEGFVLCVSDERKQNFSCFTKKKDVD